MIKKSLPYLISIFTLVGGALIFLSNYRETRAQVTVELNSGNITQAPFNCSTGAYSCNLSSKNISSIASGTFANHAVQQISLANNQITSIERGDLPLNIFTIDLHGNQIASIDDGAFEGATLGLLSLSQNPIAVIGENAFKNASGVYIDLRNCNISEIRTGAFDGVKMNYIYLMENQMTSIRANSAFHNMEVEYLGLVDNQIANIDTGAFLNTTIDTLVLQNNMLSKIQKGYFSGAQIGLLDVINNQITSIEPGSFPSTLYRLEATNNLISSIQAGTLVGFSGDYIQLSNNQIATIESGALILDSFSLLMMDHNNIEVLEKGAIVCLNKTPLYPTIDLSYNQISTLESGALYFSGNGGIGVIWLNDNTIAHIESGWLHAKGYIQDLFMQNNNLSSLEAGAFASLKIGSSLDISNNQITTIRDGAFTGSIINYLLLSGNQIATIESGAFNAESIYSIGMNNNKMTSLRNWLPYSLGDLQINNNQIITIKSGDISPNLQILSISNNLISSIETGAISTLYMGDFSNNCLSPDSLPSDVTATINNIAPNSRDNQYACINISYAPNDWTVGPVTGVLNFVGDSNKVPTLNHDNSNLADTYHVWTSNGIYGISIPNISDPNGFLHPTQSSIVTGEVTWIDSDDDVDMIGNRTDNCRYVANVGQENSNAAENIVFTKTDYGAEEDCISTGVCLTRRTKRPLYNSIEQVPADVGPDGMGCSANPTGTERAYGICADKDNLSFGNLFDINGCSPTSMIDQDMCLHIIDENKYYDLRFHSRTPSNGGGGFSYTRKEYGAIDGGGDACDCSDSICTTGNDINNNPICNPDPVCSAGPIKSYIVGLEDVPGGFRNDVTFNSYDYNHARRNLLTEGNTYTFVFNVKNTLSRQTTPADIITTPIGFKIRSEGGVEEGAEVMKELKVKIFFK